MGTTPENDKFSQWLRNRTGENKTQGEGLKKLAFFSTWRGPDTEMFQEFPAFLLFFRERKWGLEALVHNCPRLPTIDVILQPKIPPFVPQKATKVHKCRRLCTNCREVALSPHLLSPHVDFCEFFCEFGGHHKKLLRRFLGDNLKRFK